MDEADDCFMMQPAEQQKEEVNHEETRKAKSSRLPVSQEHWAMDGIKGEKHKKQNTYTPTFID